MGPYHRVGPAFSNDTPLLYTTLFILSLQDLHSKWPSYSTCLRQIVANMNANNNPQNNENPQNEPGWDEHVAEEDEKMEIKCSVCLEMVSESTVMRILEDIVCDDCITDAIVPQFEEAIKFEHKYPPTFGGVVLSFDKFSSYFDDPTFEARLVVPPSTILHPSRWTRILPAQD